MKWVTPLRVASEWAWSFQAGYGPNLSGVAFQSGYRVLIRVGVAFQGLIVPIRVGVDLIRAGVVRPHYGGRGLVGVGASF